MNVLSMCKEPLKNLIITTATKRARILGFVSQVIATQSASSGTAMSMIVTKLISIIVLTSEVNQI